MIQIKKEEWEITKMYIFDVALRDGIVNLDLQDFENKAREARPAVAVKVDEPLDVSGLTEKAIGIIKENVSGKLDSVMVVVSFKEGNELKMEDLDGMGACFLRLANENVDVVWGLQQADDITNDRQVTAFAFEQPLPD